MSEEMKDQIADYEAELEQSNFLKRQGAEAWAEMMIGMLGDKIKLDPDKAILFKQGFVEMLEGGPPFPTVMYFWRTLLANVTHAEQRTDGTVVLHNYGDALVELNPGDGAALWKALWKFIEDYHAYERSMGGYR